MSYILQYPLVSFCSIFALLSIVVVFVGDIVVVKLKMKGYELLCDAKEYADKLVGSVDSTSRYCRTFVQTHTIEIAEIEKTLKSLELRLKALEGQNPPKKTKGKS